MKHSLTFIPTMREVPSDAIVKSYQMLLRAGFIRQSANGIYSYLPLGKRVLTNIEKIIREEMEAVNAIEIKLPVIQSVESWEQSGRIQSYGPELIQFKDRNNRDLLLGPTDEELIISLIKDELNSYKKLPLTLFQFQTKFRDEKYTRHGLLRSREFIMKDAFSFHANDESLEDTYGKIFQAYSNILTRLGLPFRVVIAHSDAIGGSSHEFIVLSEIGDNTIAFSNQSDYAANVEMATVVDEYKLPDESMKDLRKLETPNEKTINDVSQFFNVPTTNCIKSLVYNVDGELIIALVRGDHQINEMKLKNVLNASIIRFAEINEIQELIGCGPGSIGPIKVPINMKVIADYAIKSIRNGIAGANEDGYHYINVNPERDFAINVYEDIRFVEEGDPSPDGNGEIQFENGIEVAHISKQGSTYTEKLNAFYLDEQGKSQPIIMGSFFLGVSRLFQAIAEQFQDDKGFIWPKQIAPYDVHVIPININDEVQSKLADELYGILTSYRYNVLYDDRSARAGVKFIDSDLIGLPVRVTIGKKASEGIVEVKIRKTGETFEWAKEELVDRLNEFFRAN